MQPPGSTSDLPQAIGRYRVRNQVGQGSFGVVYRGEDVELGRPVAIKVLHRHLLTSDAAIDAFLTEARLLASLDHPGIVPVYDVGCTTDGLYFLVARYVEGECLGDRMRHGTLAPLEAVRIVQQVATALAQSHRQKLVHRDVKPSNILIDTAGRCFVIDFGLALRLEDSGTGPIFVGTIEYMSPEQARREGHRVDGRTDIYSLGVVFYALLAGRRPFLSETKEALLEMIQSREAPPLREVDPTIDPELERICLRAASNRVSDRYATFDEMNEDLQHWLETHQATSRAPSASSIESAHLPIEAQPETRVIPHLFRAFEADDADFYLDMLPGPRTREGLPASVHFWIQGLRNTRPGEAYPVGVLYGPSGCGKSSLARAGMVPRLGPNVCTVVIDNALGELAQRLPLVLRQKFPGLAPDLGPSESIRALRAGRGLLPDQKVVLIFDQFEQWLIRRNADVPANRPIIDAFRQCDGIHVCALLLVRNEFWFELSQFMQDIEVQMIEGYNTALLAPFDREHGCRVLEQYGRAFGRLPAMPIALRTAQRDFLTKAVEIVVEEGQVLPIQLGLLADMVKDQPWTPETLRKLGKLTDIGVAFLERSFTAASAPPSQRSHAKAARAVLAAFLSDAEDLVRGPTRKRSDLLASSGYSKNPRAFADLLDLLEHQLRLITPRAPAIYEDSKEELSYQLTHDYLVPSLRIWIADQQRATRRGRAEWSLAQLKSLWRTHPERRPLPTPGEWLEIQLYTRHSQWGPVERQMLARASRRYLGRGLAVVLLLATLVVTGAAINRRVQEASIDASCRDLVRQLQIADTDRLETVLNEAKSFQPRVDRFLEEALNSSSATEKDRRRALLALIADEPVHAAALVESALDAPPVELGIIRSALLPYRDQVAGLLWTKAGRTTRPESLHAAALLAGLDPGSKRWASIAGPVTLRLLDENAYALGTWIDLFRPVRMELIPSLEAAFRNGAAPGRAVVAADLLANYAGDRPAVLAALLPDAIPRQFRQLWPIVASKPSETVSTLRNVLQATGTDANIRQRSQAALALLRLGAADDVWPLFRSAGKPTLRTRLIHGVYPLGISSKSLMDRLAIEPDASAQRALLLALGTYPPADLESTHPGFMDEVLKTHTDKSDPALRSTVEWLLRCSNRGADADRLRREAAREWPSPPTADRLGWFVNSQQQAFAVLPRPDVFRMGSPTDEPGREPNERPHEQHLDRSFAMATTQVTLEQFQRFHVPKHLLKKTVSGPQAPAANVTWYEAAAYCRWLSEQEGVPEDQMCYPPLDQIKQGMTLPKDHLTRTGYRLPTEAEWEYACRANTITAYSFGSEPEQLSHYGWYLDNANGLLHAVGLLMPNDFGLFDMHGNGHEWCDDWYGPYEQKQREKAQPGVSAGEAKVLRSGSQNSQATIMRSAHRRWEDPNEMPTHYCTVRVARTCR